jgi:hypothetical protein
MDFPGAATLESPGMTPATDPRTPLFVRGAGLSDRVAYRLMETAAEKDEIYRQRYKAYLHGGVAAPCESQRVTDRYDDVPNAWMFGIYIDGELSSEAERQRLFTRRRTPPKGSPRTAPHEDTAVA